MKFELNLNNRNVTDSEMIDDLKSIAAKLQKNTVTMEEYNNHGKFHKSTIQRRFRSWFKAMELAGLENARSDFDIDDKLLLANIAEVWIRLGRQPLSTEMRKPISKYGKSTYLRHFETWNGALLEFIKNVNNSTEIVGSDKVELEQSIRKTEVKTTKVKNTRSISLRLRFSVFLRNGFRCQSCGKSPVTHPGTELHCDHVIPWSKGGKTNQENLKTLCSECNLGKGNMDEKADWE